ncbi:MAG: response regulator transcription factor [Clostridiaceae bacterium]|nr:response regulator transcription factor [Clostridiaceae bacterium]
MEILIVDDSELIRERLVSMLTINKNIETVGQAGNSIEAMAYFKKYSPEMLLLDIHLPGENGITFLEKIKKISPETTVIMITNYAYPQYRKKCMELGADYFFEKSDGLESLQKILTYLL